MNMNISCLPVIKMTDGVLVQRIRFAVHLYDDYVNIINKHYIVGI